MNKRTLLSLGIAVVAAAALVPLQAQAWTIKVTSTIFDLPDGSSASTDGLGLFGASNTSLAGSSYIGDPLTTDPLLNSTIQCATATCLGTTGASGPGLSAGPFALTVTVNGVSFVHNEIAPSYNSAMLVDSLGTHDPPTRLHTIFCPRASAREVWRPVRIHELAGAEFLDAFRTEARFQPDTERGRWIRLRGHGSYAAFFLSTDSPRARPILRDHRLSVRHPESRCTRAGDSPPAGRGARLYRLRAQAEDAR